MDDGKCLAARVLSLCLQFPQKGFGETIAEACKSAGECGCPELAAIGRSFLPLLAGKKLLALQEEYTAAFDLNPKTCLDLTWHKWGDSRDRGKHLARLKALLREEGYEPAGGELPDYLPALLEFMSVCSEANRRTLAEEFGGEVNLLAARLREAGSSWSEVLEAAAGLFKP